ncbi:hypothetical protein TEA_015445 [Camellia sinensis var. sinensis]|uniref:Aconitase A/isopropylmalate dehydratase small subunit swivel domain-containing protein n=1 Tax=Camellia sinensis var. sinensis TaxID=542762 RepID=A0A4S4EUP7_CAMSN|nr:hypothetical protein TEA_015445 [Camellia sinensis var. sinensis]
MMWIWGSMAFPFTSLKEEALWKETTWSIELLADSIDQSIVNWIVDRKYICLYGGEDLEWIRKFTYIAKAVAKAADITLEMFIRHSKRQHGKSIENDLIMQEIMTILGFDRSEQGWAVISHGTAEMAKAKASLLDGMANTGMVELGEVQLATYLAEKTFTGQPSFQNGLPSLIAFPSGCNTANCLVRYEGELSVDAVTNWFATTILSLPRILYYSKDSLVKVIFFSETGERAAPFVRQAALSYWPYAAFAFVPWREEESSFWWNVSTPFFSKLGQGGTITARRQLHDLDDPEVLASNPQSSNDPKLQEYWSLSNLKTGGEFSSTRQECDISPTLCLTIQVLRKCGQWQLTLQNAVNRAKGEREDSRSIGAQATSRQMASSPQLDRRVTSALLAVYYDSGHWEGCIIGAAGVGQGGNVIAGRQLHDLDDPEVLASNPQSSNDPKWECLGPASNLGSQGGECMDEPEPMAHPEQLSKNRFGVQSAPAIVFLKEHGVKPVVYHVISQVINVGDVKKLQDAGIYTCNGLMMHTKKQRQTEMPMPEDRIRGVALDYPEAVRLTNPANSLLKGETGILICKGSNSSGQLDVPSHLPSNLKVDIDFEKEPIGVGKDGKNVYFKDIWPSTEEVAEVVQSSVLPNMLKSTYESITKGNPMWNDLSVPASKLYSWDPNSTYIHEPPYFKNKTMDPPGPSGVKDAHCLLNFGDSITTDHISPAGSINKDSPAAKYLLEHGVERKDFNSYGSRRGNDEVMARGTFTNIRIVNTLLNGEVGPKTLHVPTGEKRYVFDAAAVSSLNRYKAAGQDTIVLAGAEYGSGSSRDWAAKGPMLLGVKAMIAKSFERIHRSNLVGMGIVPLCFKPGEDADSLGLTGHEGYTIDLPSKINEIRPGQDVTVRTDTGKSFTCTVRFDTERREIHYLSGILQLRPCYYFRKKESPRPGVQTIGVSYSRS